MGKASFSGKTSNIIDNGLEGSHRKISRVSPRVHHLCPQGSNVQCHWCLIPDVNGLGKADTIICAWTPVGADLSEFLGYPVVTWQ